MIKMKVFNLFNQEVGTINVRKDIFEAENRRYILSEVVTWQRALKRKGTQFSKTRGEVSGTGKKPFPQKGRGLARQGSLRGPHQYGGGVAFAPKPRVFAYNIPKTKKKVAIAIAISIRNIEKSLKIVNNFEIQDGKTSLVNNALNSLKMNNVLIVDCSNDKLKRGSRNLLKVKYINSRGLNVYDILKYPSLIITTRAVLAIEKRLFS